MIRFLVSACLLTFFCLPVRADSLDPGVEQSVQTLGKRITDDAANGTLKPENVLALQGKQQELENRVARLTQSGTVTIDEKQALLLSIRDQQNRLAHYEQAMLPPQKKVDPASLPPPTYVTPGGTAVIAPAGNYGSSGVIVPRNGPAITSSPNNLQVVTPQTAPIPSAPSQ